MTLMSITAELPNLDTIIRAVNNAATGNGLKFTSEAVHAATTDVVQRTWIDYASGQDVTYSGGTFRINRVTGAYVRSIQDGIRFPGDLVGEVFSTSEHGRAIETGSPARDMKASMLSSPKAKTGKDGKKYITVGFRHGTPGSTTMQAMPANVHSAVKNMAYSRRNDALQSGGSESFTWGGRYKGDATGQRSHISPHPGGGKLQAPGHTGGGGGYTWKSGLHQGMVRMGKPGHSQYMTFRRISENSDPRSWQRPASPPRPIREAVVENTRETVLALIRRGFEMDLYFMGLGGE